MNQVKDLQAALERKANKRASDDTVKMMQPLNGALLPAYQVRIETLTSANLEVSVNLTTTLTSIRTYLEKKLAEKYLREEIGHILAMADELQALKEEI